MSLSFFSVSASGRYIGEISKNGTYLLLKTYCLIGNLRAIMEISIPIQSSLKSILKTYLVLLLAIKVIAFLGNFAIGPALCIKIMSYVWPNGKFLIFPFQFGSLAIKSHSILGNFGIGTASYTKNGVLCTVKCEISNISPIGLVQWLSKPWHFGKFCCFPTKICCLSKLSK